ncbi:MAG: hypothetical protein HMLIMOIP_001212 [Candidatus Nitrosomirales archaeon]|jgi:hypothetical protein
MKSNLCNESPNTKQTIKISTADIGALLSEYSELVLSLKTRFPHTDLRFLLGLMSHEFLYPEHAPTSQIEIFYRDDVDLNAKGALLSKRIDSVPAVYDSEKRVVIESRLELDDIGELAQDRDIESLAGEIVCCLDTLLNRRKYLV